MRRDLEAGAELGEPLQRLEPLLRLVVMRVVLGARAGSSRRARASGRCGRAAGRAGPGRSVGAVDEHRVGARDVEAPLDDRRADQHVELAVDEVDHHLLELALRPSGRAPIAMRAPSRRRVSAHALAPARGDVLAPGCGRRNLAAARRARARSPRAADRVVEAADERADREPVGRRRRDDRELAQPGHRHVQRARDRRRGQRQHVDLRAQLLEPLLVGDAEALLLVDDQQAEVLEPHVARQQAVGADDDVELALGQRGHRLAAARPCCGSATASPTRTGKSREALGERAEVLLGEHRGRRQHRHLLAAQHREQDRAQRDLGLAVADVAADQAVHRLAVLHVGEHASIALRLIGRLLERERRLELAEHRVGRRESVPGQRRALGVELQQLLGELARLGRRPAARFSCQVLPPSLSSRPRRPRRRRSAGPRRAGRPAGRACRRRTRGGGSRAATPRTVSFLRPR